MFKLAAFSGGIPIARGSYETMEAALQGVRGFCAVWEPDSTALDEMRIDELISKSYMAKEPTFIRFGGDAMLLFLFEDASPHMFAIDAYSRPVLN